MYCQDGFLLILLLQPYQIYGLLGVFLPPTLYLVSIIFSRKKNTYFFVKLFLDKIDSDIVSTLRNVYS